LTLQLIRHLSCLRSRPEIKPFRQDTFLKTIEASGIFFGFYFTQCL
jgi:hypothetical protein